MLLFSVKPQQELAIGAHYIPSILNLPAISHPFPHLEVDAETMFEFPDPYNKSSLAIYLTYDKGGLQVTLFIHLSLSSPPPMPLSLWSMSVFPLFACK